MNATKELEAPSQHAPVGQVEELFQALSAMETQACTIAERLGHFDKPEAALPSKDLTQLRLALKRIAERVEVWTALAGRIVAAPEEAAEPVPDEGKSPTAGVVSEKAAPEDELFPELEFTDADIGLPSRSAAEKAIETAMISGRPRYAAVFALDRINHMSARYGSSVGAQAARHYAAYLNQKLPPETLLFRWRGASYLALFDTPGTLADAKMQTDLIGKQKLQFDFVTNHRTAMVNLTVSFLTLALAKQEAPASMIAQVEQFIGSHRARQPR